MSQKKFFNKNLVSIIIPYYKKKEYILKTINSILNQSYTYYEIIIIYGDDNLSELEYLEISSKLASPANTEIGASSPKVAGATNKLLKSFIKSSHDLVIK